MSRTDLRPHDPQHPEEKAAGAPPRLTRWPSLLLLVLTLVGPPMALLYHELVMYALVPLACYSGARWMLHVTGAGFFIIALACGSIGWRDWRAVGRGAPDDEATVAERTRFLGAMGAVIGLFSALLILGQWLAVAFINPCMRV